jgi:hypothetical protein
MQIELRLLHVPVLQAGKLVAFVTMGLALTYILPFVLISWLAAPAHVGVGGLTILASSPLVGFLSGVVVAALFNWGARVGGGLPVTIRDRVG